jgi:1-acyl-sn-glycerol-3-phosphate acyltransferase
MGLSYVVLARLVGLYLDLATEGVEVMGQEHAWAGPKVIIANHPDITSVFALPRLFPDPICFLIQPEAFKLPLLGAMLRRAGQLPVQGDHPAEALAAAAERLAQGYAVVICPEGQQSPRGGFARPHTGAVRLALAARTPIVPVGLYVPPERLYTFPGVLSGRWQLGGMCRVQIGAAWQPPAGRVDAAGIERLTEDVFGQVMALARQAQARATPGAGRGSQTGQS